MMDNAKNIKIHSFLLFLVVFSNFFFGYSFQNLTIGFFPIVYVFLLILLIISKLSLNLKILNHLGLLNIFLLYLIYNFSKLFLNYLEYGLIAIRDATFVLDSIFLLTSLTFFSSIEITIKKILRICFLYSFLFIVFWFIRDSVISLSPTITSPLGSKSSLFFNFSTINITCGFFAFYSYLFLNSKNKKFFYFMFFFVFSLILMPKRMIYIWYFSAFLYLIFIDKKNINFAFKLFSIFILFYLIDLFGFLSFKINEIDFFSFFKTHLLSLFINYELNNADIFFTSTQSTVSWRIDAWMTTITNVTKSYSSFLFGLPFGVPLTDFYNSLGMLTREPHNLYITIFARTGLIGSILYIVFHIKIFKILYMTYKKSLHLEDKNLNKFIILFTIYVLFIYGAGGISSSNLTVTYHSTQFYLFTGICMSIYYKMLEHENFSNT